MLWPPNKIGKWWGFPSRSASVLSIEITEDKNDSWLWLAEEQRWPLAETLLSLFLKQITLHSNNRCHSNIWLHLATGKVFCALWKKQDNFRRSEEQPGSSSALEGLDTVTQEIRFKFLREVFRRSVAGQIKLQMETWSERALAFQKNKKPSQAGMVKE